MKTSLGVAVALAASLVLAGCSSDSSDTKEPDTVSTPKGFDLPPGVTLTAGGTTLPQGKAGTAVYAVGDQATSAVTVAVTRITKGSIKNDFRFFSLDDESRRKTPLYVRVTVRNEGPAGLGGASLPLFAHDDSNTNIPANDIVGSFRKCPTAKLPESFLPGATAKLCLVYLLPRGRTLRSIDLQTGAAKDTIAWKP